MGTWEQIVITRKGRNWFKVVAFTEKGVDEVHEVTASVCDAMLQTWIRDLEITPKLGSEACDG